MRTRWVSLLPSQAYYENKVSQPAARPGVLKEQGGSLLPIASPTMRTRWVSLLPSQAYYENKVGQPAAYSQAYYESKVGQPSACCLARPTMRTRRVL